MEMSVISSSWDGICRLTKQFQSLVEKQFVPEDRYASSGPMTRWITPFGAEIQKLTGQEYVPRYAPPRGAPTGETP